jgi:hypothetical protein
MSAMYRGDDVFELGCDMVDVTSSNRPDTAWRHTDARGHEHRWYANGRPAESYNPSAEHSLPSLVWVVDGIGSFEDGEPYEIGHYQCAQCGEHVQPRRTADTVQQFAPGLRWYRINGESVSKDEFMARFKAGGSQ